MRIVADTHVHLYPCYNLRQALTTLRRNLAAHVQEAVHFAFLAERYDCHYFRDFAAGNTEVLGKQVEVTGYENCLRLSEDGFSDLYLVAGRQIITRERIEILALTTDLAIEDGLGVDEVIQRVRTEGGIPVVSWAPGKWFFQRREVVAGLIDKFAPGEILFGDTTLRPTGWLEPLLMRRAKQKKFGCVAGSDPLPFSGEEKMMGMFGICLDMDFSGDDPVASIRNSFTVSGFTPARVGHRGGPLTTLIRLFKNAQSKK